MESNNGFSSPRNDAFNPAGLRVLVVDDDPTWLKILEKMLKKCSYEVTTCGLARDALNLLREKKDGFDIVISDVYMPDMDGFKLLEHVGLEMDLPVIMMSVDGETSRVMKGVQHGACDYLLKPIRMKELRNIWQHVFRKKIHEVRDIEILEGIEGFQMTRNGSDQSDDGHLFCGEDMTSAKKRKATENKHDEKEHGDGSTKKARVVWSVGLHQKFVNAVNQIGLDKVGPKKILDLMNVPWLTRENVASHLQKYRLYLSRLQKENDPKTCTVKHSDSPSKDSPASIGIQNTQQNDVSKGSFVISGKSLLNQTANSRNHEDDGKGIFAAPMAEPKRSLTVDIPHPRRPKSSHMDFVQSFTSPESEVNFAAYDPTFSQQYPWHGIAAVQMKQELKPLHLDDRSSQVPFCSQQLHMQADCSQPAPSISSGTIKERGVVGPSILKRPYDEYTSSTTNPKVVEPVSTNTFSIESEGVCPHGIKETEISKTSMNLGISPSKPLDDDFKVCWVPGDCYPMNLEMQSIIDFPEYFGPGLITDFPVQLNDASRFDYDNLYDPTEYSLIEQGLFIA